MGYIKCDCVAVACHRYRHMKQHLRPANVRDIIIKETQNFQKSSEMNHVLKYYQLEI